MLNKKREMFYFLCLMTLIILSVVFGPLDFLLGKRFFFHDSLVTMTHMHLFFESILNMELPLWSPHINAGAPLWPIVENMPAWDPVALVIWPIFVSLGKNSLLAYQWTSMAWLSIFALGGAVLSRRILKNAWVNTFVYFMLFLGPLGASVPMQSYGFLIPFRYTPWALVFILRFLDSPSRISALNSGIALAISFSGYQTLYSMFFIVVFMSVYLAVNLWMHGSIPKPKWSLTSLSFSVATLSALPMLLAGAELLRLYPIARVYFTDSYVFPWRRFVRGLLDFDYILSAEHGGSALGMLGLLFVLTGLLSVVFSFFSPKQVALGVKRQRVIESTWAITLFILLPVALELFQSKTHTFLMLRNWGFLLTLILLCFSQLFVVGIRSYLQGHYRIPIALFFAISGLIVFVTQSFKFPTPTPDYLREYYAYNFFICCVLAVGMWLVASRLPSSILSIWILPLIMILGMLDLLRFAKKQQHDLISYASAYQYTGTAQQVEARAPKIHLRDHESFISKREWSFNYNYHAPFIYEGPSVVRKHYAWVQPRVKGSAEFPVTVISHQYREPRYQKLIYSGITAEILDMIFAVTSPMIQIPSTLRWMPHEEDVLRSLSSLGPSFLEDGAILEGNATGHSVPRQKIKTEWHVESYQASRLRLRINAPTDGFVIYKDGVSPGWQAFVDGKSTPIYPANVISKAVGFPAGAHTIEFSYRPSLYIFAFWVRAVILMTFILSWLCVIFLVQVRKMSGYFLLMPERVSCHLF